MDLDYGFLARRAFETYKAQRRAQGGEPEYERFEDQPDYLQDSGLQEAMDMERKAALLGLRPEPLAQAGTRAVGELSPEQVEALSIHEHDRWMAERIGNGWVYGPVKDIERREHPCLVPWEELSEAERDQDRRVVRNLIPFFEECGYALCRAEEEEADEGGDHRGAGAEGARRAPDAPDRLRLGN